MLINILILLGSLFLILLGANKLTDGSAAVAAKLGVSDLIIGLTVVAFGTSAPELVISLVSAIDGAAPMAIGNVVGSNIFNICAIVGITALISPIKVGRGVLLNEIPMVILSSVLLLVMANAPFLDGAAGSVVTRVDGIILLIFFVIFMSHTFKAAKSAGNENDVEKNGQISTARSVIYIICGLAGLIIGGEGFVESASSIAKSLGVSDAVIGLTIVAAGTSLPELATSIAAAIKGKEGLAVGNVIGSNIFNIFMVLGITSTVKPLSFGTINNFDLLTLVVSSILFWLFGWFYKRRTITRAEGAVLFGVYVAYIIILLSKI